MEDWKSIASAPFDQNVQLWVEDHFGPRALPYPCRLTAQGWISAELNLRLATSIKPAYWRDWPIGIEPFSQAKDPAPEPE